MVHEIKFDVWQLMRSAKHYDQQNQRHFRCFIHSQDAIQYRHLQEKLYIKITESFNELSVNTDPIDAENDVVTERFSVLLYDRTTKLGNITEGNICA